MNAASLRRRAAPLLACLPLVPQVAPEGELPERYLRIAEEQSELRLEVAVRALERTDGEGPTVLLVGAAHVAGGEFYDDVQALLDGLDVTLFEGVRSGERERPGSDAPWRRRATRTRLRALMRRVEAWRSAHGDWPESLEAALADTAGPPLAFAARDAWGHRLELVRREEGAGAPIDIVSRGADGEPGGDGEDADLALADEPRIAPVDSGHGAGLQADLADALGLVFQLDAIDSTGPHWRNCDMTLERLEERLAAEGIDSEELVGLLDGSSVAAKMAGKLLGWLGSSDTGSGVLRLVGIELLGRADELLEAAPGDLADMMDVLLVERNAVVVGCVRDLAGSGVETVGVFYGAAHLRALEAELESELGYRATATWWLPAIRLDTAELGLPAGQVKMIRGMVRSQLQMQLNMARRMRAAALESEEPEPEEPGSDEPGSDEPGAGDPEAGETGSGADER